MSKHSINVNTIIIITVIIKATIALSWKSYHFHTCPVFKLLANLVPKLTSPVAVFPREVDDLPGICLLVVYVTVKMHWSEIFDEL